MGNRQCCGVLGSTSASGLESTSGKSVLSKQPLIVDRSKGQQLQKGQNHLQQQQQQLEQSPIESSQLSSLVSASSSSVRKKSGQTSDRHPLDKYQMLVELGRGAYGDVSLVKRRKDGKLYAMKVVKKEKVAMNLKIIEATKLEQRILQKSRHPFIVKLSHSFQTEGNLYIIMEFMQNGDLFSVLQKARRFDENTARFVFAEVVLGLQYLHEEQNTMYRDLKPENILVGEDHHIKLSDFGLAKQFVNKDDTENAFLGTPQYLAPEIVLQHPYDKNIDLWTLGILLYELLCGKPPFGGSGPKMLMREIALNKPQYPAHFSANAVDLIKKLLQSNAQKRIGSQSFNDLRSHAFFEKIDWDLMMRKSLESPLKQYVPKKPERAFREKSIIDSPKQAGKKVPLFDDFTYNPNSLAMHEESDRF